jgi:molybdopterin converting factor small subunit
VGSSARCHGRGTLREHTPVPAGAAPTLPLAMTVRVLLFGPEAAAAGRDSVSVEAEPGVTCRDLLAQLGAQHAPLRPFLARARLALNSRFAAPETTIHERDEVALIGLVSGG